MQTSYNYCINYNSNIFDENDNYVDTYSSERHEQDLANKYIQPDDVVIELGARYGSVSVVINKKLSNKKNQVSVEPDYKVWNALEKNKKVNGCEFNIIKGIISNGKKYSLTCENICNGYGTQTIEDSSSNIPIYSLDEIKQMYNLKFNVLVADCEGFLQTFFDENPSLYKDLKIVIYERDGDYTKMESLLVEHGFINVEVDVYIKKEFLGLYSYLNLRV
jgi:FkbM family methyltransferase